MSEFPIQHCREFASIPWKLLAPHASQARRNHSQTLEELAQRGGLSACEAVAVIEGRGWRGWRGWRGMSCVDAASRLRELVAGCSA